VTGVGFQEEGKWMYTGGEDCSARIWDLRYCAASHTFATFGRAEDNAAVLDAILNQFHPPPILIVHFPKIHFYVILPSFYQPFCPRSFPTINCFMNSLSELHGQPIVAF
jgi:hypothetical protein